MKTSVDDREESWEKKDRLLKEGKIYVLTFSSFWNRI